MRALNIFFNVDNKQQSVLSEQHLTYFQENDILENINDRVGWYEIKPQYIEQFLLYFDQLFDQEKLNECPTYLILDSIWI